MKLSEPIVFKALSINGECLFSYPADSEHIVSLEICFGVVNVKTDIEQRAVELALYIVENGATVRAAAKQFGVSKSTVHKDDGVIIGTVKGNAKKH